MLVPHGSHPGSCFTLMGAEMEMHNIAPVMAERRRSNTNTQSSGESNDFEMFFIQISSSQF